MKKKVVIFFIVLSLSLSIQKPVINAIEYNSIDSQFLALIYHFLANFTNSIKYSPLSILLLSFGVYFIMNKTKSLKITSTSLIQKILSLFLAVMTLIGSVYASNIESITIAFAGIVQLTKSGIIMTGWFFIFEISQLFLTTIIKTGIPNIKQPTFLKSIISRYQKKPFTTATIVLTIMWLPLLILNYPGIIMGDSLQQITQFFGFVPLRSDNPILSTVFISAFVKLGQFLGSANFGIFLHSIVQSAILVLSLAFSLKLIQRFGKSESFTFYMTFLLGFLPIISGLINVATKDLLFSASFLVFIVSLAIYLHDQNYFWKHRTYLITIGSILIGILLRKNSLYVAILSLLVVLVSALLRRSVKNYRIVLIVMGSISLAVVMDNALVKLAGANNETLRRESLSVVFQQTARYAHYYDEEITLAEKETINKVLDYDKIKNVYNPRISDPVKATHLESASSQEMKDYLNLWFKQFKNHPLVYLEATLNQNYSFFYLEKNPNVYYLFLTDAYRRNTPIRIQYYEDLGFKENKQVKDFQLVKKYYYQLFDKLPVLSQLNNVAFYIILLMMIMVFSIQKKKNKTLVLLIPLIALFLSLLAGPVVTGYVRYLIPFVMCGPLVFAFSIWENRQPSP
ncbi:DUF6020 family protein [Vagococcus salmoninarum]|uniref:Glycosyltransferase RgtA/B/C/D-like domain-containing protein n=1 Tax=Vagococcus salmoninarum TaxID=2739 RepID=A0A429ZPX2_9ENTE|nr:DUF6020 family protein [Vagococcus salmoninarum]RST95708.1 hypothetical protein CBF35_06985 [Vagococcus salmoninarum]